MPHLKKPYYKKMLLLLQEQTLGRTTIVANHCILALRLFSSVSVLQRKTTDREVARHRGEFIEEILCGGTAVIPGRLIIEEYFNIIKSRSNNSRLLSMQAQNIMSRRNHQQIHDSSEEAQEVQEELELLPPSVEASEEEGEDLLEAQERDYQPIQKLDQYEDEGVDHEHHQLNPEARRAAEKQLQKRERLDSGEDVEVQQYMEDSNDSQEKRTRQHYYLLDDDYDESKDQYYLDAEEQKGRFESWVNLQAVRKYIRHHFTKFITQYSQNGKAVYLPLIKDMVLQNKQSLTLDYAHLRNASRIMAKWLAFHPISFIPEINAALFAIVCKLYPNYKQTQQCFVRIHRLPVADSIRQLSHNHLGKLVKICGMITCRSEVLNQLIKVSYKCIQCGFIKGPYHLVNYQKPAFDRCNSCQSKGPFVPNRIKSIYRNFQTITIQQSPSSVPPGRIPRSKEAIICGDIIDTVKPGDQIELVGVFLTKYECSLNVKQGFPVFSTFIQTNSIRQCDEIHQFAKIDQQKFQDLPKIQHFENRFYNSIAPSIYGHERTKKSLTIAMFGGVRKQKNHHRIRGDINVLLLGDPGIAKSQFLKSIQKVFPRCIYTTGKGASAVGLTACVKKDFQTDEWRLEAGALVLADKGICLIDEFDKMSEVDRTSIHEAMEQQTISISKAGIIANLNARCSVIAAANPLGGRYNESVAFSDNVNLTPPILSRFDLVNVIKDKSNKDIDERLSTFVVRQHMRSHPYSQIYAQTKDKMEQQEEEQKKLQYSLDFIKQYIKYAREKYNPNFTVKSSNIIQKFYSNLRKESEQCGGINIVPRHLQSMVRICQAHARMHLRQSTNQRDALFAVSMMVESFIQTQKHSVAQRMRKKFKNYLNLEKEQN